MRPHPKRDKEMSVRIITKRETDPEGAKERFVFGKLKEGGKDI